MEDFLKGNAGFEELQNANGIDELGNEFIQSYKKLINESNAEVPDFDPFEKINAKKIRRISLIKRTLPYAATIIIILGIFVVYRNNYYQKSKVVYSEQELLEIKKNTEMALLHFSKELNACMAKFEDAKKLQQPANEIRQLKDLKIEKDNSLKNIKIN